MRADTRASRDLGTASGRLGNGGQVVSKLDDSCRADAKYLRCEAGRCPRLARSGMTPSTDLKIIQDRPTHPSIVLVTQVHSRSALSVQSHRRYDVAPPFVKAVRARAVLSAGVAAGGAAVHDTSSIPVSPRPRRQRFVLSNERARVCQIGCFHTQALAGWRKHCFQCQPGSSLSVMLAPNFPWSGLHYLSRLYRVSTPRE